jgi:carotenoid cleavage dioxygenase-like enzyme
MDARVVARFESTLPADDDHPYRTGPWRPNVTEWHVRDCDVIGDLPDDLAGVYLRNTENPLHPSLGRYHPFDGDGMLHAVEFGNGSAAYRNRFVRTAGFEAELAAGGPLWAGLAEPPNRSLRDGWGARTRMKDASSTDVVVHAGRALTSFYQCGDLYAHDPTTLEQHGAVRWNEWFPAEGVSAHSKVDPATGELFFFNYSTTAPFLHVGVVDGDGDVVHYTAIELPGPRLPHDLAFTENFAVLNDCPLFWDAELLARGIHAVRFHPDLPTRLGILPRRGGNDDIRWFEASPTYVLHWINAFEDGDEVVVDGFFERNPEATVDRAKPSSTPGRDSAERRMFRFLDATALDPVPYRWRLDLRTGLVKEEALSDTGSEFGTINGDRRGRRYGTCYSLVPEPGWFLFRGIRRTDVDTGRTAEYLAKPGVFVSEAAMAPRRGARAEDDGYVVTLTTDVNEDRSECLVFDAADLTAGPLARVQLPERICSGTHSTWWPTPPDPRVTGHRSVCGRHAPPVTLG